MGNEKMGNEEMGNEEMGKWNGNAQEDSQWSVLLCKVAKVMIS